MRLRWAGAIVLAASSCLGQSKKADEPLRPAWCRELPRAEYKSLSRVDSADPWFEVYRIRSGVFAIYEPHQFEEVISYLIVGGQRALLFDTGIGVGNMRAVVAALTSLPVTVLNSHTHFDHVGGNAGFSEILGVDSHYSRKNAAGEANAYAAGDALAPDRVCGTLPQGAQRETYKIRPWKITRTVHDGDQIDLGARTLEVLFTPGHTPDSLMLLDRRNRLLFTGDMFYRGPIYLYVPETDTAAYQKSIARVAALTPQLELLLPAHNLPVADPKYLGRVLDAFREVREHRVKPVLADGYAEYRFDGFSFLMLPEN
jgi:glyoxylase-like metal-dependent hydrolase (beta-lactamase superfamily II)